MSNNSTRREDKVRKKAIILIIIGILATIILLTNYLSSNKDNGENINTTAKISSKKESNEKASSSSIKFDPIEIYNAPNDEIMPQDDGTIIIEGKTAPNKKVKLDVLSAATDNANDNVVDFTTSDKEGYFKFNFDYIKDPELVDIIYCLDEKGSVTVDLTNDNYEYVDKHLKLVRNENIDYSSFRNLHAKQHYGSHSSSDSSITIDAEITFN